jgi:nucleoid DNA-binding protein
MLKRTGEGPAGRRDVRREKAPVTKKDIVRQISEVIGETQLKTKEIVQRTFDAIIKTLLETGRIELRKFGVFEVKQRKARKARNPRTNATVEVPPKNVVTFKPGKEMEEKVRALKAIPKPPKRSALDDGDGLALPLRRRKKKAKVPRAV